MPADSVAVIGTGANADDRPTPMAYHHGRAYESIDGVEIVACADVVPENAAAFAEAFDLDEDRAYSDHDRMLAAVEPDLVSICAPPGAHADLTVDAARAGVRAVHCEKPMAKTWGDARRMATVCGEEGVQLTFNHQRRFGTPWCRAKELLDDGEIGDLVRVETSAPNLFDWGTHCIDLCGKFVDEADPQWVLGGIDYAREQIVYGAHQETQAVATWAYEDGTTGFASMGEGDEVVGCFHRLIGTEGTIEVKVHDGPTLRVDSDDTDGWRVLDCEDTGFFESVRRAITDVVDAAAGDGPSELRAENALRATQLIFGTWESSRRRGRVEFPLDIEDNPLEAMVEAGDLTPAPADD